MSSCYHVTCQVVIVSRGSNRGMWQ